MKALRVSPVTCVCARARYVSNAAPLHPPSANVERQGRAPSSHRPAMELNFARATPVGGPFICFFPLFPSSEAIVTVETEIRFAAVRALRRRASRQGDLARAGSARTEGGMVVRTSAGAVAHRLAEVLAGIADEVEGEGRASWLTRV